MLLFLRAFSVIFVSLLSGKEVEKRKAKKERKTKKKKEKATANGTLYVIH